MAIDISSFRYRLGTQVADYSTLVDFPGKAREHLETQVEAFSELQERLYADNHYSLLIIFQGMDAAGKDSTIKHVTSGVNPMGFQVFNFKQPTYKDLDHNYLWRYWRSMPERGRIGIFNRSYYEEVLVVRVHPEILEQRRIPQEHITDRLWETRFGDMNSLERHMHENGTRTLKFFLNVSPEEQRQRLLKRLHNPDKYWKFDPRDIHERKEWDEYRHAYQQTIAFTHTDIAPWYIIPADDKWTMRAIVAEIIVKELEGLKLAYPEPTKEQLSNVTWARRELEDPDLNG